MKAEIKDIQVGQGLGSVKFGMTREQVIAILGQPAEKDIESVEEEHMKSEIWHYDALDVSLGFDEDENWRLVSIAVSSEFYKFDSAALIGKTRDEVEDILEKSNLHDLELDDLDEEEETGQCLLISEESEINFWFENDTLTEIQWGPLFEDDDTIIWPA